MAQNKVFENGTPLRVAVSSPVVADDPVVIGGLPGVALTDYSAYDGKATVDFNGVFDISVKGVNNAGNSAVVAGDELYYVAGDSPPVSKKASGVFFGYALEGVNSSATATINVKLASTNRSSFYNGKMFISEETTATGSAQNIAHGLGVAPTKVLVSLTEFASNVSVDVAEGAHDATNVILTVTSGVKFKVFAIV